MHSPIFYIDKFDTKQVLTVTKYANGIVLTILGIYVIVLEQ